jgi:hypothetical protein
MSVLVGGESGLSEESVEQIRAVLHPSEPDLDERDEVVDAGDGVVGDAAFEVGQDGLDDVEFRGEGG